MPSGGERSSKPVFCFSSASLTGRLSLMVSKYSFTVFMDVLGYQPIRWLSRYAKGILGGWQHPQTGYYNICSYCQNSAGQRGLCEPKLNSSGIAELA